MKQSQASPQKLGPSLVLPRKLESGRQLWLYSRPYPQHICFQLYCLFGLAWLQQGLAMLSKELLDSSDFYASVFLRSSWDYGIKLTPRSLRTPTADPG